MDALAVLAEEGRLYNGDIVGETFNSLRSGGFRIRKRIPITSGYHSIKPGDRKVFRIVDWGAPGELKHLSSPRKRNHMRFRQ